MKIKTLMTSFILAALPVASALGEEGNAVPQTAEAMPSFTLERAYFGTETQPAGSSLASLVRSLDRARENGMTRRVAYADYRRLFHGNSMQVLLQEQDWRTRVSRELKALLN